MSPRAAAPAQTADLREVVPRPLSAAMHDLATRLAVPPRTVLLAAWTVLLSRITELRKLSITLHPYSISAAPIFNASLPEDATFSAVLRSAAASVATHSSQLATVDEPADPRVFVFQWNVPPAGAGAIRSFELQLSASDVDGDILLAIDFDEALYTASIAQRYLRMLLAVLDGAVAHPDALTDQLPMLSTEAREAVLRLGQGPVADWGPFEPVHTLIERRQREGGAPDTIAVECDGHTLTVSQLQERADSIAAQLAAAGVQPHDHVALSMARSADMVATLLAILRMGCAYVPLDTRYPPDRVRIAVTDSSAKVLVTDGSVDLPPELPVLKLRATADTTAPDAYTSAPNDAAYLIYTSGSTGTPKAVALPHSALWNLLYTMELRPSLSAVDTIVAITTISFDIATMEIFLALMTGARLVIATDAEARDPSLLLPLLKRVNATVLQATPGVWRALVEQGWNGSPRLKVLSGGEAMSRNLADKLIARSDSVWNMYGPTETTVYSAQVRVVPGDEAPQPEDVLENQSVFVLDRFLQPVPPTVTGELYIGGDGLALGYWRRPELTAEKFLPNPFGPGRIYCTGDLAEFRDDGRLRLQGRSDFQVKVNGYRIETGEIEHVLLRHPAVREAVVVAQSRPDTPDQAGITRLVAFIHAPDATDDTAKAKLLAALDSALTAALPAYMLPSMIVQLGEIPRLLNGKVNRNALPDTFQQATGTDLLLGEASYYRAPRDFLERQLTQIWQSTLGIPRVSISANFFSFGAGSLAALRLITRINRAFAMDFGLASLLTKPTIAEIAEVIRNRHDSSVTSSLVPIQSLGSRAPLFILYGVGGNILTFLGLAHRLGEDQPVYAIQSQVLLTGQPALLRIEDMAAFYIREIKTVQPHGPYNLLGYSFGGTLAAEMSSQLRAAGEEIGLLAMLDARTLTYDRNFRASMNKTTKASLRVERFTRNTRTLNWKDSLKYISSKVGSRGVRILCRTALALNRKTIPSAFKDPRDVNVVALDAYAPKQYAGELVLFRASSQDWKAGPADLGWSQYFSGPIEVHEIPGDHEGIFLEPAVETLAAGIRAALEQASA